jgi:hypothetical protein
MLTMIEICLTYQLCASLDGQQRVILVLKVTIFFFLVKKKKSSHIEASLKPAMTLIILHTRVQVP